MRHRTPVFHDPGRPAGTPAGPAGGGSEGRAVRLRRVVGVSRAYTHFVRLSKVVLPLVAFGLIALLAAWPILDHSEERGAVPDGGELEMINARYFGFDRDSRPFSVLAERARQSTDQPGVIDLVHPDAEITLKDGSWLSVRAERGRYDEQAGRLLLTGDADVIHDQGYEFRTDEVHVDLNAGSAWGDRPVQGQGPFGEIFAQGFRIRDEGTQVVFVGPATTNLVLQSATARGTP